MESGMSDDVISAHPQSVVGARGMDRGVDHLHKNDALGIQPTSHTRVM